MQWGFEFTLTFKGVYNFAKSSIKNLAKLTSNNVDIEEKIPSL